MKPALRTFDTRVAKRIGRLPRVWYDFFAAVGFIIRPMFWIILSLLVALLSLQAGNSALAMTSIIFAACVPISTVMKLAFRRQRPVTIYTQHMRVKSYSFPSSHSYAAALGSTLLGALLVASGAWVFIPLLLAIVVTVGVSRIYVGAHYPTDVLGGILLGAFVGGSILLIANLY